MSEKQFISHMLNISEDEVESVSSIRQSDESVVIRVKLKVSNTGCPICGASVNVYGYLSRKII